MGIPLNVSAFLKVTMKSSNYSKTKLKTCLEVRMNFCIPSISIWLEISVHQEETWLLTKPKWCSTQIQGLDCYKGGLKHPPKMPVCNLPNKGKNRLFGAGKQEINWFWLGSSNAFLSCLHLKENLSSLTSWICMKIFLKSSAFHILIKFID